MRAQEFLTEDWGVSKEPIPLPIGDYLAGGSDEFAPPGNYRSAEDLHDEVADLIDAGVILKWSTLILEQCWPHKTG